MLGECVYLRNRHIYRTFWAEVYIEQSACLFHIFLRNMLSLHKCGLKIVGQLFMHTYPTCGHQAFFCSISEFYIPTFS